MEFKISTKNHKRDQNFYVEVLCCHRSQFSDDKHDRKMITYFLADNGNSKVFLQMITTLTSLHYFVVI